MKRDLDRSQQQQLDGWLIELARADHDAGPRPGLEARMLAAWDEAWAGRTALPCGPARAHPRAQRWVLAAVAGLAAAFLVAVAVPSVRIDGEPARSGRDEGQAADVPRRDAVA